MSDGGAVGLTMAVTKKHVGEGGRATLASDQEKKVAAVAGSHGLG